MSGTLILPRFSNREAPPAAPIVPLRYWMSGSPWARDEYIHPGAIAIALAGFSLFLAASAAGWAVGYMALLVAIIYCLSLMYFVPMIELGRTSAEFRGEVTHRNFMQFLHGEMQTATGPLSGMAAVVQIGLMPVLLGCLMSVFAMLWVCVGG